MKEGLANFNRTIPYGLLLTVKFVDSVQYAKDHISAMLCLHDVQHAAGLAIFGHLVQEVI